MVSDLNTNFGGSRDMAKKGTDRRICIPLFTPLHDPGDDQLFEYDEDSNNSSDGFEVEEDGAIRDMQSEELGLLLTSRRM